jgi:hypothetical protein
MMAAQTIGNPIKMTIRFQFNFFKLFSLSKKANQRSALLRVNSPVILSIDKFNNYKRLVKRMLLPIINLSFRGASKNLILIVIVSHDFFVLTRIFKPKLLIHSLLCIANLASNLFRYIQKIIAR